LISRPYLLRLEKEGFAVVPVIVDDSHCDALARHVEARDNKDAGSRTLLGESWCVDLARQLRSNVKLQALMPCDAVAVQCTLFDKSPTKNWLVALHQDLSIPVKSRVDRADCSGWSEKDARVYVQPPVEVLKQLLAIRVHVDPCPAKSGALRVVPRSHTQGRLDSVRADELRTLNGEVVVPVPRGGALVMRPLLLHASSKASHPQPRRVLHFVFGPPSLPLGLEWQNVV
jgi:hypothetical protein